MKLSPLPLRWRSLVLSPLGMDRPTEDRILRRLSRELALWEGTPYRDGENTRGVGTYCTAFVCSILDALYRQPCAPLPEIPPDAAMHSRATAVAGLRWFLRRYPAAKKIEGSDVEPGDILITGPVGGGPGHAILVGPRENTIWQCSAAGVHFTGLSAPSSYVLHCVYRLADRSVWGA